MKGIINLDDLLALINDWGRFCNQNPSDPCRTDVNGSGTVNVYDLLELINLWSES